MEQGNYKHFSLRFSYSNYQHRKVLKILDDLNLDIYKSKTQFIIDALDYYITSLENGDFTNSDAERNRENETKYATKEEMLDLKEEIRKELYEDIIKLIGGGMLATGISNHTIQTKVEKISQKDAEDSDFDDIPDEVAAACMEWS